MAEEETGVVAVIDGLTVAAALGGDVALRQGGCVAGAGGRQTSSCSPRFWNPILEPVYGVVWRRMASPQWTRTTRRCRRGLALACVLVVVALGQIRRLMEKAIQAQTVGTEGIRGQFAGNFPELTLHGFG